MHKIERLRAKCFNYLNLLSVQKPIMAWLNTWCDVRNREARLQSSLPLATIRRASLHRFLEQNKTITNVTRIHWSIAHKSLSARITSEAISIISVEDQREKKTVKWNDFFTKAKILTTRANMSAYNSWCYIEKFSNTYYSARFSDKMSKQNLTSIFQRWLIFPQETTKMPFA